jgi:hypothetical protein
VRGCGVGTLADQIGDLAHDPVEVEVLGGVDASHAGFPQRLCIGRRDDATDHDRYVELGLAEQADDLRHQLAMGSREDRQPNDVDILVTRRGGDLLRGEADALVDDLHAHVTGANGDLLGSI